MPFSPFFPRSFSATGIRDGAPAASGVYGLSNSSRWIFIGETDNIQAALLAYLAESTALPTSNRPSGFVFELCDRAARGARLHRLIGEYSPSANPRMR